MKEKISYCLSECKKNENCIFKGIDNDLLVKELYNRALINSYKKNQTIFSQGNRPYGIYCIFTGKVKIVTVNNEGKESILRLLCAGNVFGHRAFFSNGVYNGSAVAIEDSDIVFFDGELIKDLTKRYPSISYTLLSLVSQHMGAAEDNFVKLAHKNVRERFAELLIKLKINYGVEELRGCRLDLKLSREEMAAMIATTHETLVRLFTEFKNEGIVQQEGKTIYIINEKKLHEFANL